MNIDNYRVFIRVAKIGNLTAAAEQLGYTQSGISHIVSALEQEFGFQLLRRSKTGVSLTQGVSVRSPQVPIGPKPEQ